MLFQKLFQRNVHDVCDVLYYYTFLIVILSCDTVSDRAMHFDVLQLVCDDEQDKKKNWTKNICQKPKKNARNFHDFFKDDFR